MIDIKLLSGALGAEIKGIDLKDTSNENFKKINDLLLEHKVIFFRDQVITAEQHIALAEKFGPLETHAYVKGLEKYPEIVRIIKAEDEKNTPTEEVRSAAKEFTGSFQSVRRGATRGQREQGAKANSNPGGLLKELGIGAVGGKDNIIKNLESTVDAFLNGTRRKELANVFRPPVYAKDAYGKIGLFVPLTKMAMKAVRVDPTPAAREFAFWLHSVIWASHKTNRILGDYAVSTARQRLRVDFGSAGFVIYFSLTGWNNQ